MLIHHYYQFTLPYTIWPLLHSPFPPQLVELTLLAGSSTNDNSAPKRKKKILLIITTRPRYQVTANYVRFSFFKRTREKNYPEKKTWDFACKFLRISWKTKYRSMIWFNCSYNLSRVLIMSINLPNHGLAPTDYGNLKSYKIGIIINQQRIIIKVCFRVKVNRWSVIIYLFIHQVLCLKVPWSRPCFLLCGR